MRIIFSRKGFDSGYGGVASPILPDERLLSLPIPHKDPLRTFESVQFDGQPLSKIVQQLTKNKLGGDSSCHLDPDLRFESADRKKDWRPIFGQVDAAQTHLRNQGVKNGDLFLFFGWFKKTELWGNQLVFSPGAKDLHIMFGWLQVGEIHHPTPGFLEKYPWANDHPHCLDNGWGANNAVYLAVPKLSLPGFTKACPGGGVFPKFKRSLQLTTPGGTRSVWRLPAWMHPEGKESSLSYHGNPNIWNLDGDYTILRSMAKGQEFVLNADHYPEAMNWARGLFENALWHKV